jgi:hypothetical protein
MFLNNFINLKINNLFILICLCAHLFFWDTFLGEYYLFNTNIMSFKVLIIYPFFYYLINNYKLVIKENLNIIYIGFFLLIHLLFNIDTNSFFSKNLVKLLFILTVLIVCRVYKNFISNNLKNITYLFLVIFFFIFLLNIIFYKIDTFNNKYFFVLNSFIFLENSHFAMSILPVIFFLIFYGKSKFSYINILGFFLLVISTIFFYSTTLFLGFFVILSFSLLFYFHELRKRSLLISISLFFLFYSAEVRNNFLKNNTSSLNNNTSSLNSDIKISSLIKLSNKVSKYSLNELENYNYDFENLQKKKNLYNLWKQDSNLNIRDFFIKNYDYLPAVNFPLLYDLSTNVIINSAKVAFFSLREKFYGYGINNYEFAFAKQMLSENITVSTNEKIIYLLNYNDASNNFFKLITEFGIFSLIFTYILIKYAIADKVPISEKLFFISIVLVQLCRGAGYINGGFTFAFGMMINQLYIKNFSKFKNYG